MRQLHRVPPHTPAILRPLWVYLLRAQGKPILLGLPHGQEEAGSAPVVPHERIFPKGDVRCSFWKEKSRLPCPMPSAMPAGPHIPLESDMRLPGAVAAGGSVPAHGPQDAPHHIKFPCRGISRPTKGAIIMAKKVLNERCPLQTECERKTCEYVRKELECPY